MIEQTIEAAKNQQEGIGIQEEEDLSEINTMLFALSLIHI